MTKSRSDEWWIEGVEDEELMARIRLLKPGEMLYDAKTYTWYRHDGDPDPNTLQENANDG